MRSLALAIAIGLVGAAALHIVIILALPGWTGNDAWTRVVRLGETDRFYALANEANSSGLLNEDLHINVAVCRFDLTEGPVRVQASGAVPVWTASAFDTDSSETFSINDRSSISEDVDITFVTPAQMLQLRRAMPESLASSVLVALVRPEGYVVLRAVAPLPSLVAGARAFLTGADCAALVV